MDFASAEFETDESQHPDSHGYSEVDEYSVPDSGDAVELLQRVGQSVLVVELIVGHGAVSEGEGVDVVDPSSI